MNLHSYQNRAVKHLHNNPRSALFMEMGLGKTAVVLRALEPKHLPALVVAPKRVAEHVWPVEQLLWRPDLTMALAVGKPAQRAARLRSGADIVVISRDNFADVPVGMFTTIVLDELSGFKSHKSTRWKLARKLCKDTEYVWGLTGTPAPNGYLDLWSQMYLLDKGQRLMNGIVKYRSRYFTPGASLPSGVVIQWKIRPGAAMRINKLIDDLCLSMSSADYLELPPTILRTVDVDISSSMRVYNDLKETLVADLRLLEGTDAIHTAANPAVLSNKLVQLTSGFLYSDVYGGAATHMHNEKTKAVQEIVDGTGSPVLVFYRFKVELAALKKALPQARTMDSPNVISDWNAGKVPVLLAHPASAGHGLNLQRGGHVIVFATLPWSLEEYQQSVGRLARQGQTHSVIVHHVIAPGTVDEVILAALQRKDSVQSAIMAYLA